MNYRLHKLEITDYKHITALTIDADGKHVSVTGPNGSGKTSTVDAIWEALKGSDSRTTPEPIRHGAKAAEIRLDLGAIVVTKRITPSGSRLTVTAADGSDIKSPQKLLDSLLGTYSLDPVAFLTRRPQDQVDDVLAVCGVTPPMEQVLTITGEVHTPKAGESADTYLSRLSADENGLYYIRRREQGRDVETKRGAVLEAKTKLEAVGGRITDADQAVSVQELLDQLAALNLDQDSYRQAHVAVGAAKTALDRSFQALGQARNQYALIEEEIAAAEMKLARLREDARRKTAEVLAASDAHEAADTKLGEACTALENSLDPSTKIAIVRERLANSEARNKSLEKRRSLTGVLEQWEGEHAKSIERHESIDAQLAALRDLRLHLLDGVDLGIAGLQVIGGEIYISNVPFRQGSHAERLRVACGVAMKQKPALRLLRVDDGEHLDTSSRALLLDLAQRNDWQVIITAVNSTVADLQIEIFDAE